MFFTLIIHLCLPHIGHAVDHSAVCLQLRVLVRADMLCFSRASGVSEGHLQQNKWLIVADVARSAEEVKYENLPWALDAKFTESQCSSGDLKFAGEPRSVKLCTCDSSHGSSNLAAPDNVEDLGRRGNEISDSGGKAFEGEAVRSSDDVRRSSPWRAMEQQRSLQRPVRPRSLEVADDTRVNTESHQYANLADLLRAAPRAASGNCLDIRDDRNRDDAESASSSSASASAAATTPVGRIVSSSSVDAAIGRTMCRCNDVDLMSYRFAHNSIELESAAARDPFGVSSTYTEHCFRETGGAGMVANYTGHCSRPAGEVSLLNEDLLKYAQRSPRSVSMPVDIVSARRLPPDQRVGNSLASGVNSAAQDQEPLQPIASGCTVPPSAETKALRKRAYRVGLNLFNR